MSRSYTSTPAAVRSCQSRRMPVPVLALARIIYFRIRKARLATHLWPDKELTL